MKKHQIFNNKKVTHLLGLYAKDVSQVGLRDRIVRNSLPLIDAALSKKHIYANRDDIRQECILKMLYGLEKYEPGRGSAFAFLWTLICNTCITQGQRMSSKNLSLSTDETAQREAEVNSNKVFETPENRHILNALADSIQHAFRENGFLVPKHRYHRRVCVKIRESIQNGELFYNRVEVMKSLGRLGLDKKEVQFYLDYTLIMVREKLLEARENASALIVKPIGKNVPEVLGSGIF